MDSQTISAIPSRSLTPTLTLDSKRCVNSQQKPAVLDPCSRVISRPQVVGPNKRLVIYWKIASSYLSRIGERTRVFSGRVDKQISERREVWTFEKT